MNYDYFYGQSGELFSYFRIPKALFQDHRFRQLSTDARTLYGILLDRMSLSAKNGWLDEQGRVYIIYTVREVQESLCCAEHKAVKLFRELEDIYKLFFAALVIQNCQIHCQHFRSHPSYREELCQFDTIPLCPFNQTTTAVPATGYPWPVPRSFWRGLLSGESISPCRSADVPRHR